jgi:hypothetical protein
MSGANDSDHFETLETHEHEDQRELMRLYHHEPHDRPQFNRAQMRMAIFHGKQLALQTKTSANRGFLMIRLFWRIRYTMLALRSRYEFTLISAWSQSAASWDDSEDGAMTPTDCLREDAYDWRLG